VLLVGQKRKVLLGVFYIQKNELIDEKRPTEICSSI
jgi:hypothetical protein